jgi:hypothetical protein
METKSLRVLAARGGRIESTTLTPLSLEEVDRAAGFIGQKMARAAFGIDRLTHCPNPGMQHQHVVFWHGVV